MNYICPDCGAYLDPEEICDCKKEKASSSQMIPKENIKPKNRWAIEAFKITHKGGGENGIKQRINSRG